MREQGCRAVAKRMKREEELRKKDAENVLRVAKSKKKIVEGTKMQSSF